MTTAFETAAARFPHRASANDVEAEAVHERVAEHVERVRDQRDRTCDPSGNELDDEHHRVDHEHDGQRRRLALLQSPEDIVFVGAAGVHRQSASICFSRSGASATKCC